MMTYTTNILLLSQVENLLPQPLYSFEFTDYFFLEFIATISTPICVFFKLFYATTETIIKLLTSILILITLSMYEGKYLYISQEIYTHSINNNSKTWLGFFLLYLKQNINPTRHMGLGLSWKILQKNNLHEFRSIKSNFRSIKPCKKWTVIFCNYSIPTLQ